MSGETDEFLDEAANASGKNPSIWSKPRVVLADDHMVVTDSLRKLLEQEFDIVGTADDGRALLKITRAAKPDLVVVDISMPSLNGIDSARLLRQQDPGIKIVFLTMYSDAAFVQEAMRAGAQGYVTKRGAAQELIEAMRKVLRGKTYVSPSAERGAGPRSGELLSSRQREVLQLVAEGKQNKEIATILNISPRTVEFHKSRIMTKLNLHTTAALTKFALDHGISAGGVTLGHSRTAS
jgi:DNA-binding NarL/FixJ family response regulator